MDQLYLPPPPPYTRTIYRGFEPFMAGVLDLTLNKFRMELQGLLEINGQ